MAADPPPSDPGETLRRRIRQTVEEAVGGAGGQSPDPGAFMRVVRLERMLDAYERTRPLPRRRLWPVVGLISAIAFAVWLLLVVRVPSTSVSLALDLSSVAFRIGTETPGPIDSPEKIDLVDAIGVDEVAFASFGGVEVDEQPIESPPVKLASGPAHEIVLHPLAVPAGTWVRVRSIGRDGGVTLELEHPTQALELALTVPTGSTLPPGHPLAAALDPSLATREVVFWAEPDREQGRCAGLLLTLRLGGQPDIEPPAPEDARRLVFAREIPAEVMLFTDIEDRARRRKRFSTIQGGTAFREELANREVSLRPGEFLDVRLARGDAASGLPGVITSLAGTFGAAPAGADAIDDDPCRGEDPAPPDGPATGTISRLVAGPTGLDLEARARVAHLSIGTLDARRDLMPRRLERLQSGELLPLFWGAFLSVFGVCYTVFRYLRDAP
jgi:hypothetical protein